MTELALAPESIGTGAAIEGSAPVLITEQEVMFSTAAAVLPVATGSGARWWNTFGRRTTRVYPPRRDHFMADAAMRREMCRL
jgi:hypothetical protein